MFLVKNNIALFLILFSLAGCSLSKNQANEVDPQKDLTATAIISSPQQNWAATIDRASLRFFATQASHVLLGTVTKVDTDAQVSDFSFAGLEWKIYYDRVTLSLEQAIGESLAHDRVLLLLHPMRCEAFHESKPVNVFLSNCQMRQPYNTLNEGEQVLVFVRGRLDEQRPPLVDIKFPVRGREVDLSSVEKPPVSLEDAIEEILEGIRLVRGESTP